LTPLQQQFAILNGAFPEARLRELPSGAAIIEIPNYQLPAGWSQSIITLRFLAPVGYPFGKPDCFWADPGLRLAGGGMPNASGMQAIPETPEQLLWFSWHVTQWNPNRDSLMTYERVIRDRFRVPR